MTTKAESLTQLIRQVRTCFNQMRALVEALATDLEVNPSMRAVMESLAKDGACTVPDLARERGTSRQHVQTVINALLEHGHVRSEDNPAHKRSVLYSLTKQGEEVFAEIQQREMAPMSTLLDALDQTDITAATEVLARVNLELDRMINKGNREDDGT